ncbi:alpha/beta hydrolase [uncultured Cohaesibacter sp.]|uniref:alpha/beta hydrolase n=1 Tax=uncultured Cohaesibacter sp. TaxID=1002546 RepID=UPI0029C73009|nr:alpha/beta hydrolase [uncultured Cohaesibacter sp.]
MHLNNLEKFPELADGICHAMTCWDNSEVRVARWPSLSPTPKGTICLLQGRAEFIEKYYEVITELRQRGFAVATLDWRGQGMSDRLLPDRMKGHVRRFTDYGRDLEQFIKDVILPDCPPPCFALAHSMGGLILLNNLPRLRTKIERAFLCAPLIEINTSAHGFMGISLQQPGIRKASGLLRYLGLGNWYVPGAPRTPLDRLGFYTNKLTSDGPRYDRNRQFLIDAPELGIGGPTILWTHEISKALDVLQSSDFQPTIHTPTFILTAGNDAIVNSRAAELFALTTRAAHATSITGSKHEIMMEREIIREQFWAAFDCFIPGTSTLRQQSA